MKDLPVIHPSWNAAAGIKACTTTRLGGYSQVPYDSLNLGLYVNDERAHVLKNREHVQACLQLPSTPRWLRQVHGCEVMNLADPIDNLSDEREADAAIATAPQQVIAILTADCLPVVFASRADADLANADRVVAAAHAGWRGLAAGVLQQTVAKLPVDPGSLCAWMGPAIGPHAFEVGEEVRQAFLDAAVPAALSDTNDAFLPGVAANKWMANLYALGSIALRQAGITAISGGDHCTFSDTTQFFSHRREGPHTGRMVTLAWIE